MPKGKYITIPQHKEIRRLRSEEKLSFKQIAERMNLKDRTVYDHAKDIKLDHKGGANWHKRNGG